MGRPEQCPGAFSLPPRLAVEAQRRLVELQELTPELAALLEARGPEGEAELLWVLGTSPWCARQMLQRPEWLRELLQGEGLSRPLASEELECIWQQEFAQARALGARAGARGDPDGSVEVLDRCLRRLRNRVSLRLIWRDFCGHADMACTAGDVALLARWCIQRALDVHYHALCEELGTPVDGSGRAQQLVVLGLGKLGGNELNLSSDIDLILTYPRAGETQGGPGRSVSNQEFFQRLGQRLIRSLDQPTADGQVFRVDMRLRPYGSAGALVLSFDAMEAYYQEQGRDWERFAMLKAQVVAGDQRAGGQLLSILRPFVYRRYLDYSAIASLRDMKAMIRREIVRRQLRNNIKLGSGGIREVEFIVQCIQLIRGGREPALQESNLLAALAELGRRGLLPGPVVEELREAYVFLRDSEHAIQGFQDQQSHDLPVAEGPRQALAGLLGHASWEDYYDALNGHRQRVARHFAEVIASPEDEGAEEQLEPWLTCWRDELELGIAEPRLQRAGHEEAGEVVRQLTLLRRSSALRTMQGVGRERLERFMPQLLAAVLQAERPSAALLRILPLVEAVLRRTAYLVLLAENPGALRQLVELCAASPWIARELATHPVLLDELLERRSQHRFPDRCALRQDLQQQLLRVDWHDLGAQVEGLCYFRLAHALRAVAAEVTGRLPLMKVSDYLTWVAEVILEHVLELAWRHLEARHGRPCSPDGDRCTSGFAIIAYGKLGGIELSHDSDLDLVFLHDADPAGCTDGERSLDNSVLLTRLGQRILHILTIRTPLGTLYEVDLRLRPGGAAGLLVSSLKAYVDYQTEDAWTWEHQALVRARAVAGEPELMRRFEAARRSLLQRRRDPRELAGEVVAMRQRMREHHAGAAGEGDGLFDLKHGEGAIVDIEFMVQYAVLAWSHKCSALMRHTDNIRILEVLEQEQLLPPAVAGALREAYKVLRAAQHRLGLQGLSMRVPAADFAPQREVVRRCWQTLLGGATPPE